MADDSSFAALPSSVQQGGGNTDMISRLIEQAAQRFATLTSYDPQDPPWGDDLIGNEFMKAYAKAHAELREAVTDFAGAVSRAGQLTLDSGTAFEKAQQDNLDTIHREAGRRA
ncbi:hypothetical protein ACKI1Q_35990 [Streptomyces galilaeus]|uniref:hypothetical protein n=1 Tax=Streptomyces galilaeus TaxID=33899 RepID=UPI0038F6CC79